MSAAATGEAFAGAREHFETIMGWLDGEAAAGLTHGELEEQPDVRGRALLRQLLQDHLDVRASREPRSGEVVDDAGVPRGAVETGHRRVLGTVFGQVDVERMARSPSIVAITAPLASARPAAKAADLPKFLRRRSGRNRSSSILICFITVHELPELPPSIKISSQLVTWVPAV